MSLTAPDSQSALVPFFQSNGLLLQVLGGVNIISDFNGNQVQNTEYDPWGKVSRSDGNVDPTHRFTGQELDSESDIHYYGGRYYDQGLGRFVSPDPFVQDPDDPQNLNRYSYVLKGRRAISTRAGTLMLILVTAFPAL